MIYIGIDPGKGGGICFIKDRHTAKAYKCPETIEGMASLVKKETRGYKIKVATIEHVHSMPRDGVVSAFSFGRNFGSWLGILHALNIGVSLTSPQKWMKKYHPLPKEKKSRKHRLRDLAKNHYPGIYCTLATADAILIAKYGAELSTIGVSLK
jgi:hypothetical protein